MREELEHTIILEADGSVRTCLQAAANLHVLTEAWVAKRWAFLPGRAGNWHYGPEHAQANLEIEVTVDDDSGEDGEAAPVLRLLIDREGWHGAGLAELIGTSWREGAGCTIEAFYGNDAPDIEDNVVAFSASTLSGCIAIDWRGSMRWRATDAMLPFRMTGPVRLAAVAISVKQEADVAEMFAAALPGFALERLGPAEIVTRDIVKHVSKGRRVWQVHRWALQDA